MKKLKYPIYIPSKGRAHKCLTADFLLEAGIPFKIVIEPQDFKIYSEKYNKNTLLLLPKNNPGSVTTARNFIKEHSRRMGDKRHWQLDDNIRRIMQYDPSVKSYRSKCDPNKALILIEDFIDRYENVAIAGLSHVAFARLKKKPFQLNQQCYSCVLVLNKIKLKWREGVLEDTDYSLQVLASGWCTILLNVFMIAKENTGSIKGGNTDTVYAGDGRIKQVRKLQRLWPGTVKLTRKFGKPRQVTNLVWRKYDTPLIKKRNVK